MAGEPYTGGGIRTTVAATRAAGDDELRANVARLRDRGAAPGHHHHRDQDRVRPHRRRRGPVAAHRPRVHRRDHVPRRARRPAGTPTPDDYAALVCGADARRLRARTPSGSTCSASGAPSTATRPARCSPPGAQAGLGAARARQPAHRRARRAPRRGARRGQRRPLHAPHATPTSTPWPARDTVATLLPGRRVLHPLAVSGRPPPARRRCHGGAGDRLQSRFVVHHVACRSASRSPSARWA